MIELSGMVKNAMKFAFIEEQLSALVFRKKQLAFPKIASHLYHYYD